jgi:hypothetical protein
MTVDPHAPGVYRVLVTGSRSWTDTQAITRALDDLHAQHTDRLRIIHGACPRGADAIAHAWADAHGVPVEAHPAHWSTGRSAGPARNAAMVATRPDLCLAYIADHSRGATDTAARAEQAGIPTRRHTPAEPAAVARTQQMAVHGPVEDDGALIAVLDGPLAGQWFTWADWQTRLKAAHYMADRTGRRSPVLDYVPAGCQVPNPVLEHTRGWAAVHRPAAAESAAVPASPGHDTDLTDFGTGTGAVEAAAAAVDAVDVADDGDVFEAAG